ncbi:4Fe-4S binding protein [Peptacetobacter sp.]|uniref:4Fe-4S binding protein n=1 Tax=Peptacetobacter sp. TaxID=2991975 RepID=UPI0026070FBC|nr:4Fe-4S binding protein [Peptacetobacter sp.]
MKNWIKDKKRKLIQLLCAILYNCNISGFAKGNIYKGEIKSVCVPGLNCYSCPGAIASCPIGSLQTALVSARYKFPYYIIGLMLLFGILLGRVICGFLCPFGLIQELLYKIPSKKIKKGNWSKKLSSIKYIVLIIFVILIPIFMAAPGFCKYICPAGTAEAGIILVSKNDSLKALIGFLFNWKIVLMMSILVSSVFIFRIFCRFICPLGAFYALFNRISVFGFEIDSKKCNGCNACTITCKLDVKNVGDMECIQCGDCMKKCSQNAIQFKRKK